MSAIDTTFHWVRNPTAINGLQTTYCSKRGSDVSGDGTAQKPYASIAKITSVTTAGNNIMLDDAIWSEQRTLNNRSFKWWGNGNTTINDFYFYNDELNFFRIVKTSVIGTGAGNAIFNNCFISSFFGQGYESIKFNNCIILDAIFGWFSSPNVLNNCIIGILRNDGTVPVWNKMYNCIFLSNTSAIRVNGTNNNFTIGAMQWYSTNSINDAIIGQAFSDYFNYYDPNDWSKCDFTAKKGSKNLGAGTNGQNIGLNEGFPCRANDTETDIFKATNGAVLKSINYDSTVGGYVLSHKEKICAGATSNTITFASDASTENDYYNGLFVGINSGDGVGEIHYIIDYDGATKTATIQDTFTTIPTTSSFYSVSGTITSAIKDFGKVIKIKRNWTFQDSVPNDNGEWQEFLTHYSSTSGMAKISSFHWRYSKDNVLWQEGSELNSATNGEAKMTDFVKGDCSEQYSFVTAGKVFCRYVQFFIHIGFSL